MENNEILKSSMEIIMHAGDARMFVKEALTAISKFDFGLSEIKLKKAQDEITIAHIAQTDMIQCEAKGELIEHSLLFTHAQDTLMTIYSELNIAKQMLKIFSSYEERISKLEKKE